MRRRSVGCVFGRRHRDQTLRSAVILFRNHSSDFLLIQPSASCSDVPIGGRRRGVRQNWMLGAIEVGTILEAYPRESPFCESQESSRTGRRP